MTLRPFGERPLPYPTQHFIGPRQEITAEYLSSDPRDYWPARLSLRIGTELVLSLDAGTAEQIAKALLEALPSNLTVELEETFARIVKDHSKQHKDPECSICRRRHGLEVIHARE